MKNVFKLIINLFATMFAKLRKMVPIYLAVLVVCGVMANAGVQLPETLQWMYKPVEQTTAYAASVVEDFESAAQNQEQTQPQKGDAVVINQTPGTYQGSFVASTADTVHYVLRIPENLTVGMPLIVYLHEDNIQTTTALSRTGVVRAANDMNNNNCVVLQPLNNSAWCVETKEQVYRELATYICNQLYCDTSRIVLTGRESGAIGAWYYTALSPDCWSKVSPVSAAPMTDVRPLVGKNISYYLIYGEYEEYSIKGDMKRIGRTMMENGAAVVQCEIPGATHEDIANNVYDANWFAWACQ